MRVLVRNGFVIDPAQGIEAYGDLYIDAGKISALRLKDPGRAEEPMPGGGGEVTVIDAKGCLVVPGLVDMHAHLREPGFEYKETIRTGTRAAVRGGFASVCCMPNTHPVNDNATVTDFILRKTYAEGSCYVYPIGAISKGQKGEELAEMGTMHEAGCVAFSDDGRPVMNSLLMRRALEYSKSFDVPLIAHCEDCHLSDGGVMNEGLLSMLLGLKGIPDAAEEVMVARDIALVKLTGGRLHIAHVSTKGSVAMVRRAKEEGLRVTAETCPHYFTITEAAVTGYDTNAKVNPPLRTAEDVAAIKEGLRDGSIDVIATDHAPHHRDEKLLEFDKAPSGISGLETALSLALRLADEGVLTLSRIVEAMATKPAAILGIDKGTLRQGSDADVVVIDREMLWKVDSGKFASLGRNTPFEGWEMKGRPAVTICKGRVHDFRTL
jgi:dihydroorotase